MHVRADDGISVEILDPVTISKVKKIYFEPLGPGPDAEAGDLLDHLALMIVKGFSDASTGGRFVLVSGDDSSGADAVIKGHVEEFKVRGHLKKMATIKVRADLRLVSDDEVVALMYAEREFKIKGKNSSEVAYNIGHAMAQKLSE